jgi:hypothetical protein
MLTDVPPRKANRADFLQSDRTQTLDLPLNADLQEISRHLESAMRADTIREVQSACTAFLTSASNFYTVPTCDVRVLAARPLGTREHGAFELFGDYAPDSLLIRVWMRTAVRKKVTSFGTLVSTLCHEFCHHLDFQKFGFRDSWHTRGFYERAAALYHHARGTPLKKLFWIPVAGGRWRIDWPRTTRSV